MSAHADVEGIAESSGEVATPERESAGVIRWIAGGLAVGAVVMYALFGVLIYVAVTALA